MSHEPNVHGDLERELRELGQGLAARPTPDVATAVRIRLQTPPAAQQHRRPRRRTVTFGVIVALVVAFFATPAHARNAVLSWLQIPGVSITHRDPSASRPPVQTDPDLGMGSPVPLAEAQRAVPFALRHATEVALGTPEQILLQQARGGAAVTFVYRPSADLPRAPETGAGALLSQFAGSFDTAIFHKIVYNVPGARSARVGTAPALWVPGPQDLILGTGDSAPFTARRAANSLLWARDGITFRLEAALPLERALQIASSVH
jgi:hypothetical protein